MWDKGKHWFYSCVKQRNKIVMNKQNKNKLLCCQKKMVPRWKGGRDAG